MAFKKKTKKFDDIAGFWNREGILQGYYLARIVREVVVARKKEPRAFYLFKTTEACEGTTKESQQIETFKAGSVVGVSASAILDKSFDGVKDSVECRITSLGKKDIGKGQTLWDFEVEIDEESTMPDDENIPF